METSSAAAFDRMGTLGVEEEFFVVDPATDRPTSGSDELVYEDPPEGDLADRIDHELFKCVLEVQTPLIESIDSAPEAIRSTRKDLSEHVTDHGYGLAAAGLHPAANWQELEHAEKPRYKEQLDRIQYPQHRNTTAGVHVHVGVDDADKAVWIANELRWYLPIVLAVSANSPYWCGIDTGLQSARAKIFENLPNTGVPTAFEDFQAYLDYEKTLLETDAIDDRGELWFDVRPHGEHGTVEIRVPDTHHDVERTIAFVEYSHAIVTDLAERYEDGAGAGACRQELLDENKWRALRYGRDAELLERGCTGASIAIGDVVDRECDRLDVEGLREVYEGPSGAARQREIRDSAGMDALCEALRIV
ncbi:glutamate--cysteine ligase [Halococcoides cellulosivorans]|uniref:Glutamate--cysteine ligase n=1 Tax=Halococcoides cellulosivorans TaxID=1679096 RepID=A0A2R4WZH1_9EURY|nr:glutamate--cysteine ligase [Halococcoides cellulosivorans]AWB26943.1 carboxylate--amine ligase [Halococcoides cellulosivorans]